MTSVGEVFPIPLDKQRSAVGQVIAKYGKANYFFAVFDTDVPPNSELYDLVDMTSQPVILLSSSLDAKLYVGHWTRIGTAPVHAGSLLPAYKIAVGRPDNFVVEDDSGEKRRNLSIEDARQHPYREVVAPVRVEKAARAAFGLEPWREEFDHMAPGRTPTSARVFD